MQFYYKEIKQHFVVAFFARVIKCSELCSDNLKIFSSLWDISINHIKKIFVGTSKADVQPKNE